MPLSNRRMLGLLSRPVTGPRRGRRQNPRRSRLHRLCLRRPPGSSCRGMPPFLTSSSLRSGFRKKHLANLMVERARARGVGEAETPARRGPARSERAEARGKRGARPRGGRVQFVMRGTCFTSSSRSSVQTASNGPTPAYFESGGASPRPNSRSAQAGRTPRPSASRRPPRRSAPASLEPFVTIRCRTRAQRRQAALESRQWPLILVQDGQSASERVEGNPDERRAALSR